MAKKYLDQTGLALVWAKIKELVSTKVDKVEGKGLSSNDYTSDEKTKLAGIASGAQVNVLEGIQKNGNTVTVTNKIANISVPTKTSDITNDSGFITSADVPEGAAASTTTPKMNGTAAVGTEMAFARGDHVHPSDTSRVPTTRKVAGHALSTDVTLVKSDVGLGNVDNTADVDKPISTAQQTALDNKVDKVTGKGLSTNDYTTAEKSKLNDIQAGAQVNPHVNVNGSGREIFGYFLNDDTGVLSMWYSDTTSPDGGLITVPLASAAQGAIQSLSNAIAGKVDAEDGKGLSTNDYTTAEKNKLAAFGAASTYALKTDITNMYKYKGSVKTINVLPSTGQTVGDVYNVELTGMNYAWNGTEWDALGEIFTITSISNDDINTIVAS